MIIKINENQYHYYITGLYEGVDWNANADGTINMSVNTDNSDKANTSGKLSVDTRVFGNRRDILYGQKDSKGNRSNKGWTAAYEKTQLALRTYRAILDHIEEESINVPMDGLPPKTINTITDKLNEYHDGEMSKEELKSWVNLNIERLSMDSVVRQMNYDRIHNSYTNDEQSARYNIGMVPDTNVKFIALFSFKDFNFSDAIKHGEVRPNGNAKSLFTKEKLDIPTTDRIPVTYDSGKVAPNIANNFSMNGITYDPSKQCDHYRTTNKDEYTSVSQFIDKSIMYAKYALSEEGFNPDFIVACPSSSKFNDLFCKRLSEKLGKPYISDFFQRNVVNVKFGDEDEKDMLERGFNEKDIIKMKNFVKSSVYGEIASFVKQPIVNLVKSNANLFEKFDIDKSINIISKHALKILINTESGDLIKNHLAQNFINQISRKTYNEREDVFLEKLMVIINRIGRRIFQHCLLEMSSILSNYTEQIETNGYRLNFNKAKFKITQIDKRYRPYIHNAYIIANKAFNTQKDAEGNEIEYKDKELLSQFKNGKFLIYDEDINSGGTLKLVVDTLKEKLPSQTDNNIICLANAYSNGGM